MTTAAVKLPPDRADDVDTLETINGVTLMSPRPAPGHAGAAIGLSSALYAAFDEHYRSRKKGRPPAGPGGWRVLPEPELRLRKDKVSPDLAAWRIARMPVLPKTSFIDVAPDWVCEILSPRTETIDRYVKMPVYASAGVPSLWLLSVAGGVLEVYRLSNGMYEQVARHQGSVQVRVEPFPEVRLDLAPLWP